jgi:hypothetical protein
LHYFSLSVADLLGVNTKEDALTLLEQPLRCHLLLAQIDAGMWRRNGEQTMLGYVAVSGLCLALTPITN